MTLYTRYVVWKIAPNGEYSRLIKQYKSEEAAKDRASQEAEDEWRPSTRYVVKKSQSESPQQMEDRRASDIGLDGIAYRDDGLFEASSS